MKLERLANELLLDLFEFLDAAHLFRAFYGLNSRFNALLFDHTHSYHLDVRSVSKQNFNIVCHQYLPMIVERIISFHLSNKNETPNKLHSFLSYGFTLDQFNHLQKLSLYHMNSLDTLNLILIQCQQLPHLTQLNILKSNFQKNDIDVRHFTLNNIWCLSKLTHCNLDRIFLNKISSANMSVVSQSIEYLSIENIHCPLGILFRLFEHTPRLRQLRINDIIGHGFEDLHPIVSSLSSLNISFSGSMEVIFRNLPNLQYLTIRTLGICLNGHEWEKIIVDQLSNLKVFRLKMVFRFPLETKREEQIDDLLDSFRTKFWIEEHRWFVRYDVDPTNVYNYDTIYTLPYAFEKFVYRDQTLSKSTCPKDKEYRSYNRVRVLQYLQEATDSNKESSVPSLHFPDLRHLELDIPRNKHFLTTVPLLSFLTSFKMAALRDSVYLQLQALLDQAPHLYSLTVKIWCPVHTVLFQLKNSSIRRLSLYTSDFSILDPFIEGEDCAALAKSPLGMQCEILRIPLKDRTNILDLVNEMSNLRSLIVQCKDDQHSVWPSSSTNDELIYWLQEHLPSTCSITRDSKEISDIRISIDS